MDEKLSIAQQLETESLPCAIEHLGSQAQWQESSHLVQVHDDDGKSIFGQGAQLRRRTGRRRGRR